MVRHACVELVHNVVEKQQTCIIAGWCVMCTMKACRGSLPVDQSLQRHCLSSAMTRCKSCFAQKHVSGLSSVSATWTTTATANIYINMLIVSLMAAKWPPVRLYSGQQWVLVCILPAQSCMRAHVLIKPGSKTGSLCTICDSGLLDSCTAQHSTAQHSTAQHSTAQHSNPP